MPAEAAEAYSILNWGGLKAVNLNITGGMFTTPALTGSLQSQALPAPCCS